MEPGNGDAFAKKLDAFTKKLEANADKFTRFNREVAIPTVLLFGLVAGAAITVRDWARSRMEERKQQRADAEFLRNYHEEMRRWKMEDA